MIAALVQKDIVLFFRNQFFALITGLALVMYIALYFLLPATVDETLPFAFYVEGIAENSLAGRVLSVEGLDVRVFDSQEGLIEAVENGEYTAGLVLPAGILGSDPTTMTVYYAPGTMPEVSDAIDSILTSRINAFTSASAGGANIRTETLGHTTDAPLALRDRILPTLLLMILMVEVMGLGTLIVEEIERQTANALLATPVGITHFFTSKIITGIGLAFAQLFIIVALTGHLGTQTLLLITTLLLGSLLITGIAFLIASVSRDMTSVIAWGMMVIVVLALPSLTIVFPTMVSGWMDYIPSYYLVDTLHRTLNFGASWTDVSTNLLMLLIIGVGTLGIGSFALKRRFQ